MEKEKILIVVEKGEMVSILDDLIMDIIEGAGEEIEGLQVCYNSWSHIHTKDKEIAICKKDCTFDETYDRIINLSNRKKLGAKLIT